MSPPTSLFRLCLLLIFLIILAYWQALQVSFLSDDFVLLSAAQLRTLPETLAIDPNWFFYRPLGALFWWLQYRVFSYSGALYHMVSLSLHGLNTLLVVALSRHFLPQRQAFVVGLLFALLPLHSESVTWLAVQYDLLATSGYLMALICLLYWAKEHQMEHISRTALWYLAALLTFQLSLWSKEIAFTFPFVAAVVLVLALVRTSLRRLLLALLPFCILLGLNLWYRYQTWGHIGGYGNVALLPPDLPLVLGRTAFSFLAPLNQLIFPGWFVFIWAVVVAILVLINIARSQYRRVIMLGLLWLVGTLAPVLGLLPIGADMQNARVLYLPSIGFCLLLAVSSSRIEESIIRSQRCRALQQITQAMPLVVALAYLIALQFQLGPWVVAGQNAQQVVQELHRLAPPFPADSRVSTVNLPDTFQGAYVYRLGLNHAYGHFFHQTFALEPLSALTDLRYDLHGTEAQVQFGFNPAQQRWGVSALRSVSANQYVQLGEQSWKILGCPADWKSAACIPELGVSGWLESPALEQTHSGWYELAVVADVPATNAEAKLLLSWRGAKEIAWTSSDAAAFNLPVNGGTYTYRLAINPAEGGLPINYLRIKIERGFIHTVALRVIE